jgi:tRNA modification GTPase
MTTRMTGDTIFALASGAGQAALAVMRMSGPASGAMLDALCRRRPAPRRAVVRTLRGPGGGALDRALVLWMPGPGSYTGEDTAELFLHGGRAVSDGVADALVGYGARPAEAGEFTRRAVRNGRMGLTEAEAVVDLIEAETAAQRDQALRQLDGELGRLYFGWAARLRVLLAQAEALIDFADEDLPPDEAKLGAAELRGLRAEIAAHLHDGRRGERLREGLVFAVTGAPNVGKSSLVNALAGREVAIVSAQPGTTRDVLETRVVFGGAPVTLIDTAGLRETDDPIEAEGVRRARERASRADLVVRVIDGAAEDRIDEGCPVVLVASKSDLGGGAPCGAIRVSALNGSGLDDLRARLHAAAQALTAQAGPPTLTRARHRAALRAALDGLAAAESAVLPELRAEELRLAMREIGRVTGQVGVEDVLDTIFSRFCIGK